MKGPTTLITCLVTWLHKQVVLAQVQAQVESFRSQVSSRIQVIRSWDSSQIRV